MVVWQDEEGWKVEGVDKFGPKMVSLVLKLVARRWYVVKGYILLNNVPAVH